MTLFRFRNSSPLIVSFSLLCLSGCAYMVDSSNQDVMFVTPGAEHAYCDVYIEKLRYQVFPPQKINLMKSSEDMEVTCTAPGNRMQSIKVPSETTARSIWGGPPGAAWDYASQAMFYYPSVVAVDFSQEAVKPNAYPAHNSPDVTQPETHDLEEFLPGDPRLNADRHRTKQEPAKRREEIQEEQSEIQDTPIDEPKAVTNDKGNLESVMKDLKTDTKAPAAKAAPLPASGKSVVTPLPLDEPALEDTMTPKTGAATPPKTGTPPVKLYPGQ